MRIVADENIPRLQEYFSVFGEVQAVNGRSLSREQLQGADILLVRSVTPVNEELLQGTPVGFVGTCTIGTDHLDKPYLEARKIPYASAPGCNAGGVVQYDLTALTHLRPNWRELSIGIIGCGNVGGRLYRTLKQLGVSAAGYDPYLEKDTDIHVVPFADVLQNDILCLHAPLTRNGDHPTEHLIGARELAALPAGALLLNGGRGGVIDNSALLAHMQSGTGLDVVLDVWEGEPAISPDLARLVAIGTPHIAGYSDEGRTNGSIMICQALARHLGWEEGDVTAHLKAVEEACGGEKGRLQVHSLDQALQATYPLLEDHRRLMAAVEDSAPLGPAFDALRKHYPERHEPNHYQVEFDRDNHRLREELQAVGFQVEAGGV